MRISTKAKWAFWILFTTAVALFYFVVRNNPNNNHLRLIPAQANNVVIFDLNEMLLAYRPILEDNPTILDSLFADMYKMDDKESFEPIAIVPFQKIAFYTLQDETSAVDLLLVCFQSLSLDGLIKSVNEREEEPFWMSMNNGGTVCWLKKTNVAFMKEGNATVLVSPLMGKLSDDLLTEEILQHQYEVHFGNAKKLVDVNKQFSEVILSHNQIDYWRSSGTGLMNKMSGQLLNFSSDNFIRENHLKLNLLDDALSFQTRLTFAAEDMLRVQENNTPLTLNEDESLKLSMSVNPLIFDDLLGSVLPKDELKLSEYCTGRMCLVVNGFDNMSLRTIRMPLLEEGVTIKNVMADTVPLNPRELISYPLTQVAIELSLSSTEAINKLIEETQLFNRVGDWYEYELPDVLVMRTNTEKEITYTTQKIYVKADGNSLIVSMTNDENKQFTPEFRTFSLAFSFINFANTYVPRDKMDYFAVSLIPSLEFESLILDYSGMHENSVELSGAFTMKKNEISHLLKFPMLFLKLREIKMDEVLKAFN
jgi:hypothetical protein